MQRSQNRFHSHTFLCLFLSVSTRNASHNTSPHAPCDCHPSHRGTRAKDVCGSKQLLIDQKSLCQAKQSTAFSPSHHTWAKAGASKKKKKKKTTIKPIPAGKRNKHTATERDVQEPGLLTRCDTSDLCTGFPKDMQHLAGFASFLIQKRSQTPIRTSCLFLQPST